MTGGALPAQTWHDIMVVAHQGVEIRDLAGVGAGKKLPPDASAAGLESRRSRDARSAADPDPARRRYPGARREADGRRRKNRLEDIVERSGDAGGSPKRSSSALAVPRQVRIGRDAGAFGRQRVGRSAAQELIRHIVMTGVPLRLILDLTAGAGRSRPLVGLGATWVTATRGVNIRHTDHRRLERPAPHRLQRYRSLCTRQRWHAAVNFRWAPGDGIAFTATTDDAKRPLDGRCDVVVSGRDPGGAVLDADARTIQKASSSPTA